MCGKFDRAPECVMCWEEKKQAGPRWQPWWTPLSRLGHVVRLLGVPELLVLLVSEALVVVALALEQLTKVRFAVEFTVEGGEGAQTAETTGEKKGDQSKAQEVRGEEGGGKGRAGFVPEFGVTVMAAEAAGVEDQIVGNQPLHRIDGLLTGFTHLLFHLEAERLSTNADSARFKS